MGLIYMAPNGKGPYKIILKLGLSSYPLYILIKSRVYWKKETIFITCVPRKMVNDKNIKWDLHLIDWRSSSTIFNKIQIQPMI